MLRAYSVTDIGPVRQMNEDCFVIDEPLCLLVVADGMGGHNAGEVAAQTAVEAIRDYVGGFRPDDPWPYGYEAAISQAGNLLRTAVHVANAVVFELASATPAYAGMGTTVVAAIVRDGLLSVAHVGDSRGYLIGDAGLTRLTQDDTWMASILAHDPQADPALFAHHPMRHALTNVVGCQLVTDVHLIEVPLGGGERIALTTDGVHGVVEDARIAQVLATPVEGASAAETLLREALTSGSRDNCTVVVADYRLN
ncbi:MAG: protein phosphatase 2C domain-containing protein [Acidobacteriaceae bacterium]|jgi:protein phosphatase|nr:protein phosphatase 2C domain-containing protein [Acidobacteriaceae bacterium]